MIQCSFRFTDADRAALEVAHADGRPDFLKAGCELFLGIEVPISRRGLERPDPLFATRAAINDVSVVVLPDAPLRVWCRDSLLNHSGRRPPQAEGVVGSVEPVIERPNQPAWLVLQVPAARTTSIPELLFVGDSV